MTYARETSVPIERSKFEIEGLLDRYGADQFAYASEAGRALIGFRYKGRVCRITLPFEPAKKFALDRAGRTRPKKSQDAAWAQSLRSRWRALKLIIQAKLEAVECGVSTFEQEFLANIMLPNGKTIGEWAEPQIEKLASGGNMPALLPPARGGKP